MEMAVFQRRDVQASDETATGYDDTNHESRAGKKRLYVFRRRVKDIAKELPLVFLLTVKRRSMARRRDCFDSFVRRLPYTYAFCRSRSGTCFSLLLNFFSYVQLAVLRCISIFSLFNSLTLIQSLISSKSFLSAGELVFLCLHLLER
jgi:hypothetical protein